jgi:hypothetical protein
LTSIYYRSLEIEIYPKLQFKIIRSLIWGISDDEDLMRYVWS